MGTHMLTRTFSPLFMSGKSTLYRQDTRLLRISPVEISIALDFDDGSDKDNAALRKNMDEAFEKLCKYADKWYTRDVSKLITDMVKIIEGSLMFRYSGLYDEGIVKTCAERVLKFNKAMDTAFSSWLEAVMRTVDAVMTKWNNVNNAARSVKAKRAAGVATDLASITWSAALIAVNPAGAVSILYTCKGLYDKAYSAAAGTQKKRANVLTQLQTVIDFCDVVDSGTEQTWGQWLKRKSMSVSSVTSGLTSAITDFEMSIITLESEEKKLGTAIRKLAAKNDADQLVLDAEVAKFDEMHAALQVWVKDLRNFKDQRKELIKTHNLKSMDEKAAKAIGKKLKGFAIGFRKKLMADAKALDSIEKIGFEAAYRKLEGGLKARTHAVRLKL